MTCLRAQSLITPFINDELDIKELEEFTEHIRSCSECMEELEVYYTLLTAMRQLDEDRNLSNNFKLKLSEKLDKAQDKVVHAKFTFYRKKGILLIVLLSLTVFFSIQHYFEKKEEINLVTESDFRMRITFQTKRYEIIKKELDLYLEDAINEQD
ncbi:MAG TPA: zf-HC2 domain-containing protein [Mobilitalea sp.]|nr:zf-HC2 domain-containing protein [Mobilitalea sp.]